jgi:glycosidase
MTQRLFCKAALLSGVAGLLMACQPAVDEAQSEAVSVTAGAAELASPVSVAERQPRDEIIYFVMPDRFENADASNDLGGLEGDRLDHGYDPTDTGFYHGGDIAGLTARLDYIQGLGATAIWLTPIFQNRAVQGEGEWASSAYHGYWITDFLRPDAHLGEREEFRAFVEAAHARGMRVYMDIITNHTADVIAYRECHDPSSELYINPEGQCPYRRRADYPFTTVGGPDGEPINEGFLGDDPVHLTAENFANLTRPDFAYTPYIPEGVDGERNPPWLNDMTLYHNRGESFWFGESELYGDFAGLDDLNTEHPTVVRGMIDIYKSWITDFRIDGYRIDTAKHVRPEFWAEFTPEIMAHARAEGIEHFHVFGEVYEYDPGQLARYITQARLPAFLDFAFQGTAQGFVTGAEPGMRFQELFNIDHVYPGGEATAAILPTFLGNHDMGRMSMFIRNAEPDISDADLLDRLILAHGLMMFSRGVPTIYYGDEQGFISDGNDRAAREDMFPSVVESYNDNDLVGTDATTADNNFDTSHPLYQAIAQMAAIRQDNQVIRRGRLLTRYAGNEESVLVISRIDEASGDEVVIAFNAEDEARQLNVEVDGRNTSWEALWGECAGQSAAVGTVALDIPARGFVVCRAQR